MTTLQQPPASAGFVLSEASGKRSRHNAIIAASQTLVAGQMLSRSAAGEGVTVTAAADAGNTAGAGELTLANPAYTAAVKPGEYSVVCIAAEENAGKFRVEDPNGKEVGTAKVGVAFGKQVKFTIADATDFVVGDKFIITVEFQPGGELWQAWTPGADALGVALYPVVTGAGETAPTAILRRDAEVNGNELSWSDDATDDEVAIAREQFEDETGIIVR